MDTGGFKLWKDCMAGDLTAWKKMIRYCDGDVRLLERVYLKLRPYIKTHPSVSVTSRVCPKCGGKKLKSKGLRFLNTSVKRKLICLSCGGHCTEHDRYYTKEEKQTIRNA